MNANESDASRLRPATADRRGEQDLDDLLVHVARGDQAAFEALHDRMAGPLYGVIRRVLRDPSQSEEVAQEVLLEVWRTATRYDPAIGGAGTATRTPRAPWLPWLSGAVAAAAIVVAAVFGFANAHTHSQLTAAQARNHALATAQAQIQAELDQARAHDQALAEILGAPHVRLLSQATTKGGVADVVLDAASRRLLVATSGLPALPPGKVYQLWLIGPVRIVSVGLLPGAQSGVTRPVVATGIVKGDKLGLTVEPAPGTKQPTTTPIIALPLPL